MAASAAAVMWLKFFTANIFLWEAAIYHRHGYLGLPERDDEKYRELLTLRCDFNTPLIGDISQDIHSEAVCV